MFTLPPEKYAKAALKLKDVAINTLFANSVLEQHVSGKVHTDNIEHPKAFYVLHPSGMSLLYGDLDDEFLETHLKDYLLRRNNLRQKDESLQVLPGEIENRIDSMLGNEICIHNLEDPQGCLNCAVVKYKRMNFTINREKFEHFLLALNIDQYSFLPVDNKLFHSTNGASVPNQFWDSAAKFSSLGVGFSLIYENIPVATAFSAFVHDNMLELGIETMPEYRNRGFAGIVAAKLIAYCLEKGIEPVWSCRLGNYGSQKLAQKLGFEPTVYIPYYEVL